MGVCDHECVSGGAHCVCEGAEGLTEQTFPGVTSAPSPGDISFHLSEGQGGVEHMVRPHGGRGEDAGLTSDR